MEQEKKKYVCPTLSVLFALSTTDVMIASMGDGQDVDTAFDGDKWGGYLGGSL